MPLHKESFGLSDQGQEIERYRLVNRAGREVAILTYGGIVQQLQAADRYGNLADVVLGFDTLSPYLGEQPYFGAIIGRYANRIALGRFALNGQTYQLVTNNGVHHLHGGLRGFDKQVWQARTETLADATRLHLRYTSADGEEHYPGTVTVEIVYTWSDADTLRIDYTASTDAPTVLNLTNHSYFNLAGSHAGSILQHRLQLHADRYLPVDATLIPTGELAPVASTAMDFRAMTEIGAQLDLSDVQIRNANGGYDHAWLLNRSSQGQATKGHPALAATVDEALSGRRMNVYTTQPAIQFYSGNFLDGSLRGKQLVSYDKHAGFCLETQHYPDSPNQAAFPSTVLQPGDTYRHSTLYEFTQIPT